MGSLLERKVLNLALLAGNIMLRSGAEMDRVADTITRICKACKMDNIGVFTTLTGIFISVSREGDDSNSSSAIGNIDEISIDLTKLSKVNSFAREFTTTDLSIDEGMEILHEIDKGKHYPLLARFLFAGLVSGLFSIIFGGVYIDALLTSLVGIIAYAMALGFESLKTNYFLRGFLSISVSSFVFLTLEYFSIISDSGPSTIGVLMLFVPGFSLTTSMRDFLAGDMLAGLSRLVEALAISISLAVGVGVGVKIWELVLGGVA